jgi:hypothetical protein
VGEIGDVHVFDAVSLRLNLGENFAANVKPAQLEPQGKFRLRPAVRGPQPPNLRPDKIGGILCPSWFAVCHSSKNATQKSQLSNNTTGNKCETGSSDMFYRWNR